MQRIENAQNRDEKHAYRRLHKSLLSHVLGVDAQLVAFSTRNRIFIMLDMSQIFSNTAVLNLPIWDLERV